MQPNHSDLGATLRRLIGCALLTTVLHNLCVLAHFCTFYLYFTLKVYVSYMLPQPSYGML